MGLTRRVFIQRMTQICGCAAAFSTMRALGLIASPGLLRCRSLPPTSAKERESSFWAPESQALSLRLSSAKRASNVRSSKRSRPDGRNWTVRSGSKVEFTDGKVQHCDWQSGGYFNAGPARIPSIHNLMLGYCQELGVSLEVEVNASRSALMQAEVLNGGNAVQQRQVVYDTRGYIAELLTKSIKKHSLDDELSQEDTVRLLDFIRGFGDLNSNGIYIGTTRAGFTTARGAGLTQSALRQPLKLMELLAANFSKGGVL